MTQPLDDGKDSGAAPDVTAPTPTDVVKNPTQSSDAPSLPGAQTASTAVDLDAEPVPPPAGPSGPPAPPPGAFERPFDPNPARESVRGLIAQWLVLLLAGIVTAAFWFVAWRPDAGTALKDLLQVVLGPVVALVGSATGYYFGSERAAAGNQQTPAPPQTQGASGSAS